METLNDLTYQMMMQAAKSCDTSFDGKFYVAVKTTKIYCLPSCKARFPFSKNIIFYATSAEAEFNGFRGCKRCKSQFYPTIEPSWLTEIEQFLANNLSRKVTEDELVNMANSDITTIRRYFKSQYKISLMAYHRKLRLSHAKVLIDKGTDYKSVLKKTGFQSINGFTHAFNKEYGYSPRGY